MISRAGGDDFDAVGSGRWMIRVLASRTLHVKASYARVSNANELRDTTLRQKWLAVGLDVYSLIQTLQCLVLDGVYRNSEGAAVLHEVAAPTSEELQALLARIITRIMRLLTKQGFLIDARQDLPRRRG